MLKYISKSSDYRKAREIEFGKGYTISFQGNSEILVSISLPYLTDNKQSIINLVINRIIKFVYRKVKALTVQMKYGGNIFEQKILLGFSKDFCLFNDLFNNWFDIFVPSQACSRGDMEISIRALDKADRIINPVFNKIILTEPLFLENSPRRNIIYLTLESLTDIFYLYNKKIISEETVRLFESVFSDFIRIENTVAQTDWTFPAVITYHTGLLMSQHMMFDSEMIKNKNARLNDGIITIGDILKKQGYITFSANLGKLNSENGFSNGIDVYYKPQSSLGFVEHTGDDKWLIKKLEQFKNNCFIHLHYDKLHAPVFTNTEPWGRLRTKNNPHIENGCLRNAAEYYEANVRLVLFEVGNIISYLKSLNKFDDTIFIVTSDHGFDLDEWRNIRQEDPLADFRVKVPYLINQKTSLTTKNASIRPFWEICELLELKMPEYFYTLPQADSELGLYSFSEAFLKTKGHRYILHISDEKNKYILHADIDWDFFQIKKIYKEEILDFENQEIINDRNLTKKFKDLREKYFSMNAGFYNEMHKTRC